MPRAAPHPVDRATPVEAGVTGRAVPVDPDPADPDPVDRAATDPGVLDRADPDPVVLDRADRVATDRAAPETTDPAVPAAPETTDPAVPADPETTDPAVPADPETTGCAGLAVPAAHGMATTSVATSTGPRGATDPHPGALARHRDRAGTDRFRRPVDSGGMVPSTTGATTKLPCGIPGSTSGASTSSESGSRCNESPHTTPASPIGEAGVVLIRLTAHPAAAV
jgi:hypothetical protein